MGIAGGRLAGQQIRKNWLLNDERSALAIQNLMAQEAARSEQRRLQEEALAQRRAEQQEGSLLTRLRLQGDAAYRNRALDERRTGQENALDMDRLRLAATVEGRDEANQLGWTRLAASQASDEAGRADVMKRHEEDLGLEQAKLDTAKADKEGWPTLVRKAISNPLNMKEHIAEFNKLGGIQITGMVVDPETLEATVTYEDGETEKFSRQQVQAGAYQGGMKSFPSRPGTSQKPPKPVVPSPPSVLQTARELGIPEAALRREVEDDDGNVKTSLTDEGDSLVQLVKDAVKGGMDVRQAVLQQAPRLGLGGFPQPNPQTRQEIEKEIRRLELTRPDTGAAKTKLGMLRKRLTGTAAGVSAPPRTSDPNVAESQAPPGLENYWARLPDEIKPGIFAKWQTLKTADARAEFLEWIEAQLAVAGR